MKILTSLFAIIAVTSAVVQEKYLLTPEHQTKLKNIALPCAKEFNVHPSNIAKLGDDSLPRDEATNNFLHCFAVNSGFVTKDGNIINDRIISILKDHPRVEEVKVELQKCVGLTKETPVASTVAAHKCYSANSPVIFQYNE